MKRPIDIRKAITAVLTALAFISCTKESPVADPVSVEQTRGVMEIEVLTPGADADDQIRKARFIIFDNASVNAKVDVNQVITFTAAQRDAKSFRTTLEVSQNDDKMVVLILNEQKIHNAALDGVVFLTDIENLMYNGNVTGSLAMDIHGPSPTGLPMSGVKRGIAVTAANSTVETAAQVRMTAERSLARVEVWIRSGPGITASIRATTSPTQVNLKRSATTGYLAAGTEADGTRFQTGAAADNNFGLMQDIANPQQAFWWSCSIDEARQIGTDAELLTSFYIPERMCDAAGDVNKLRLDIQRIVTTSGLRTVNDILLGEFIPEGATQPEELVMIRRNNIYRITATVQAIQTTFEMEVLPWNEKTVGVIADPQYFLLVSQDALTLTNEPNTTVITARTDYDQSDRGFAMGIQMDRDEVRYFDDSATEVTDQDSPMHGWLTWTGGFDGDMTREILFQLYDGSLDASCDGCYALVPVKAGNMRKQVRVDFAYTTPGTQYYINLEFEEYMLNGNQTFMNMIQTNYPGGLGIGEIKYYDAIGNPANSGELYGWLEIFNTPAGAALWDMQIRPKGTMSASDNGCYATVEITAGSLIRTVKVILAL